MERREAKKWRMPAACAAMFATSPCFRYETLGEVNMLFVKR